MSRLCLLVSVCALVIAMGSVAVAQPLEWTQPTGTEGFNTPTNWNPNSGPAGPTVTDDVAFGPNLLNLNVEVVLGAPSSARDVTFADGTVVLKGFGNAALNNSGSVTIDKATATALANGAQVTLDGTSVVTWNSTGDATIGDIGYGRLTVNNGGDFDIASLFIGDDADSEGELNIDGVGSSVSSNVVGFANGIFIGNAGTGTVNVTNGGLLQTTDLTGGADLSLGFEATGEGTLNISGANSKAIAEDFIVGESGVGNLIVSNGGVMEGSNGSTPDVFVALNTQSSGNATITGNGSQWTGRIFRIGDRGDAIVNIADGGQLNATGDVILGDEVVVEGMDTFTSSGAVTVSGSSGGSDSLLSTTGILTVGNAGNGTLTVEDGADVTVGVDLNVGNNAASNFDNTINVTGAGSTITVTDTMNLGLAGRAVLNINTGGQVNSSNDLYIAENDGSSAAVTIDGVGSQLTAIDQLFVGNEGTGTLLATGGALIQAARFSVGDSDSNGSIAAPALGGMATISGSSGGTPTTLNVTGTEFFVGGSSNENGGRGMLRIEAGARVTSDGLIIGSGNGGGSDGNGTVEVDGADTLVDADANGANLLIVGDKGAGTLSVTGGAKVEAAAARIGNEAGSDTAQMTIDGATGNSLVEINAAINTGQERKGTLTINNGGVLVSAMNGTSISTIGVGDDADGSIVTVDGSDSLWNTQGTSTRLRIGQSAGVDADGLRASLRVTGGGKVMAHDLLVNDGATGGAAELVIDGQDNANVPSTVTTNGFTVIGDDGLGRLTISNGGLFETTAGPGASDGTFDIGGTSNGTGFATVTGAGSTLSVATVLTVGRSSDGALVIADGGTVSNIGDGQVGRDSGANSTVIIGSTTSNESTWNNGASLYFGGDAGGAGAPIAAFINAGGRINVTNNTVIWNGTVTLGGGTLSTALLEILALGNFDFVSGTLQFTGSKTLDNAAYGDIFGTFSNPTLVADQHLAIVGNAVISDPIRVNGGTLSVGTVSTASFANVDFDAGTLNFTGTGINVTAAGLFGSALVVDEDETINTAGALFVQSDGLVNIARGVLTAGGGANEGTIVVAEGTAEFATGLTNNGNLVLIDATTAGTITNNGDLTLVNTSTVSALSLGSTSTLSLGLNDTDDFDALSILGDASLDGILDVDGSGFSLAVGQSYEILDVVGALSGTFDGLADGGLFGNFGGVDLFIDYDGGDGNDVVLFTAGGFSADFDNDGDVDGTDFLLIQRNNPALLADWQTQYGSGVPGVYTPIAAVPEPTILMLLAIGFVSASGFRSSVCRSSF